jgi:hypothetical protein
LPQQKIEKKIILLLLLLQTAVVYKKNNSLKASLSDHAKIRCSIYLENTKYEA